MKKVSVISNFLDVMDLSASIVVSEGVHVYNNELVLRESISELVLTSERVGSIKDATSVQTLLYPTKPPDDLFCGFDPDMVFTSDSQPEDCHLLNMSSMTVVVADCEILPTKVMSLVKSISDVIPVVDPNRARPSSTLHDANLDASVPNINAR